MTDAAIRLDGVSKRYPHFALEDVSLEVPTGSLVGFIGPNGAGKSTTIRILMGLVHADDGDVRVLGHAMPSAQAAAKWEIGFVSEDMRLHGGATLDWHMRLMRSIYPAWDAAYARELVRRFDLVPGQKLKGMSHGQRTKASLLLALARRPALLVLDEPTTGLDPVARQEALQALMEVLGDERRTVFFSSQNTADVEQISDQITFIDRGRIIESRDKETFLDRWRRLRVELPGEVMVPAIPGVISVTQAGRIAVATTNAFSDSLPRAYEAAGIRVHAVETMTLEEIFVSNVHYNREEVEA
jgi:ABC-2 type transport system ATP-binding protein